MTIWEFLIGGAAIAFACAVIFLPKWLSTKPQPPAMLVDIKWMMNHRVLDSRRMKSHDDIYPNWETANTREHAEYFMRGLNYPFFKEIFIINAVSGDYWFVKATFEFGDTIYFWNIPTHAQAKELVSELRRLNNAIRRDKYEEPIDAIVDRAIQARREREATSPEAVNDLILATVKKYGYCWPNTKHYKAVGR